MAQALEFSLSHLQKIRYSMAAVPAIPLLGSKDVLTYNKDTCSTVFIAALLRIARI